MSDRTFSWVSYQKVTKHKRSRDVLEEHCEEEWSRKSKKYCGYLNKITKPPLDKIIHNVVSGQKDKLQPRSARTNCLAKRNRRKITDLRKESKK